MSVDGDPLSGRTADDVHVAEEEIGLHFLGQLAPLRSDEIHRHLHSCSQCGATGKEIVDVLAALALVDPEQRPETQVAGDRPN